MKRLISLMASLGLVALMLSATAGTALGHTATPSCENVTISNTPGDEPAYLYAGADATGELLYGPVGDGNWKVPAGDVYVVWPKWNSVNNHATFKIADCEKKVYVCKYVGKPGVDERLKEGKQPIEVGTSAIPGWPIPLPSYFADSQGQSYALAMVPQDPVPTAKDCPPARNGSITFVKVISSKDQGPVKPDGFNFNLVPPDKDTGVGTEALALGTYTVAEVNIPADYKFIGVACTPNEEEDSLVAFVPGNTAVLSENAPEWTCTFTNEYAPPPTTGSLTIVKVVRGENKGPATSDDWRFNVVPPDKDVMVGTEKGLAFGSYTVNEVNIPTNYKWVSTVCASGDVKAEVGNVAVLSVTVPDWACTVTNEYAPPPPPTPTPPPTPPCTSCDCLGNCPTPTPTATPVVTPQPTPVPPESGGGQVTPPPTSTVAYGTSSDSPVIPFSLALLAVAGTMFVVTRRIAKR